MVKGKTAKDIPPGSLACQLNEQACSSRQGLWTNLPLAARVQAFIYSHYPPYFSIESKACCRSRLHSCLTAAPIIEFITWHTRLHPIFASNFFRLFRWWRAAFCWRGLHVSKKWDDKEFYETLYSMYSHVFSWFAWSGQKWRTLGVLPWRLACWMHMVFS